LEKSKISIAFANPDDIISEIHKVKIYMYVYLPELTLFCIQDAPSYCVQWLAVDEGAEGIEAVATAD